MYHETKIKGPILSNILVPVHLRDKGTNIPLSREGFCDCPPIAGLWPVGIATLVPESWIELSSKKATNALKLKRVK